MTVRRYDMVCDTHNLDPRNYSWSMKRTILGQYVPYTDVEKLVKALIELRELNYGWMEGAGEPDFGRYEFAYSLAHKAIP